MKLIAYSEGIQAQMGEAGGGVIPIRISWEDYDVEGKFIQHGSNNSTTITHTTQTTICAYDGANDGRVRKIVAISFLNSDASNARTIRFFFDRRTGGTLYWTPYFAVESHGMVVYAPEYGWKVYNAVGGVEPTPSQVRSGTGTPEAAITATVGSLFLRTDGGASTTLYVKESGTGNTGWVAK